jgi:putative copper export protein
MVAGAALAPALLRGAALSFLLAVCGLLGFTGYSSARSARQEKLCVWLSVGATLLLTAHLIVWLIHVSPENALDATIARSALTREVGLDELIRLILAALTMWSVVLARRWRLGFAFALAAVLAGGTIGHPAAIAPLITVPSKALHLVGIAFWFGGILWLATIETDSAELLAAAMTVSSIALVSIAVVTVTGVVQVVYFLSSWTDLFSSSYGITLLAKIAGLMCLFAFGAYHRRSLIPNLEGEATRTTLRKSLKREIVVMIAVIMLGGFLAYVPVPSMSGMNMGGMNMDSTSHQEIQ